MTLLWMDGVYYPDDDFGFKYDFRTNEVNVYADTRRVGPGSIRLRGELTGDARCNKEILASEEIVFGAALKLSTFGNTGPFLQFLNEVGVLVTVKTNVDTSLSVRKNVTGDVYGTTATGIITPSVWAYIECKIKISDTVGVIVLKINGSTVLNLSGLDTMTQTGASTVSSVQLYAGFAESFFWQDIYIIDTLGSANNDFLGDSRVDIIRPSAAGTHTDFTPSTGANWENVDEVDIDEDATYNESSQIGDKDSYNLTDISLTGGQIFGIQQQSVVRKDDASIRYGKQLLKSGTTEDVGDELQFNDNYTAYHRILEEDPDTAAAWGETGVNALESGLEITA